MPTTTLTPRSLRCEYLTNPLSVDTARPRLSWALDADGRSRRQSAYRILVATSAEAARAGSADLWDSGQVHSAQSTHIEYGGAALASGQRAWWTVRVWDEQGQEAAT